jgi:homoserine O-acetyltransferase/O-succinyltransferase
MNDIQHDYDVFEAGDVRLQSNMVFRGARLAYKTYGELNAERSNAILFMTPFGAHHTDIAWMIRPGAALDPERYFVIVPNLFGNGLSSAPSNAVPLSSAIIDVARFPGALANQSGARLHVYY